MRDFFTGQELTSVGRLSRRSYIIANLRIIGWSFVIFLALGMISFFIGSVENFSSFTIILNILSPIASLYFAVLGIFLSIRRLHDLNKSGWWYLVMLVPLVNLFFGLYMIFARGDDGDNIFGGDPRIVILPNGTIAPIKSDTGLIIGVIVMFCLLSIIPILATIAFLSFQGYSENARDSKRTSDIYNIQTKLMADYANTGKLPDTLDSFDMTNLQDPKAGETKSDGCKFGYTYEPIKNSKNENCGYKISACMETEDKRTVDYPCSPNQL